MWIIRSTRNDSLVQNPLQHQLLSVELSLPMGCSVLFGLTSNWGVWKPSSSPPVGQELFHTIQCRPLLLKWERTGKTRSTGELVRNADSGSPPQTYWISIYIVMRFPGDSHTWKLGKHKTVSAALFGEEKLFNFPQGASHLQWREGVRDAVGGERSWVEQE